MFKRFEKQNLLTNIFNDYSNSLNRTFISEKYFLSFYMILKWCVFKNSFPRKFRYSNLKTLNSKLIHSLVTLMSWCWAIIPANSVWNPKSENPLANSPVIDWISILTFSQCYAHSVDFVLLIPLCHSVPCHSIPKCHFIPCSCLFSVGNLWAQQSVVALFCTELLWKRFVTDFLEAKKRCQNELR